VTDGVISNHDVIAFGDGLVGFVRVLVELVYLVFSLKEGVLSLLR
jgi:hypothetical protein